MKFALLGTIQIAMVCSVWAHPQSVIEYIDTASLASLEKQYQNSQVIDEKNLIEVLGHDWTCEVFGARSGMQKLKKVMLYRFSGSDEKILNSGSSPLKKFLLKPDSGLSASNQKLSDSVRMASGDLLISRMTSPTQGPQPVAFAKCVKTP